MVTTYRNKEHNIYMVETTKDMYKMTLLPFIWCLNDPCKISLNRVYHNNERMPISEDDYYKECTQRKGTIMSYAPTVIE